MVPRELRAVEGLQHLDLLLNIVQVILGSLQLHHLECVRRNAEKDAARQDEPKPKNRHDANDNKRPSHEQK